MKRVSNHFLDHFFWPDSVAIVGATNNPFKMNFRILENLVNLRFDGNIYPVNNRESEILGVKTYAKLQDIPNQVDLVVSAVPASKTMDVLKDCARIGVKHIVIVTGGFSEGGQDGKTLHEKIEAFAREKGLRILGPNTLSPVNTANSFIVSFNPVRKMSQGNLSFAFQSGFYEPKINWIFSHFGINKMLDMGNKLDINELDALEYFSRDPETHVIAMHIESLHSNGRDFFNLLKSVTMQKPVIILKSGRTQAGSRAAASHTGALAKENDVVFDCAIRQAGAIRAQNLEEFFDLAKAFSFLPLPKGDRLAIITLSGGEGVMATDSCEINQLKLASLSEKTHQRLKKIFPKWEIPLNPFDGGVCMEFHLANLEVFFDTLAAIPEDENVDFAIMQMPPDFIHLQSLDESEKTSPSLYRQYVDLILKMNETEKPFALWSTSMDRQEMELIELIESYRLPVFPSSDRAVKSLAKMVRYSKYRSRSRSSMAQS
ncbi:MAG: CoA-binding protein [Deltaproteobacteria bacterium]|nr:CoA-binding protein [Deltaproteobacteria bacterium]